MNNETIGIKKSNVLATYKTARENDDINVMCALESLFGKDMFKPKDITERVKTFEDACRELGKSHPLVCQYNAIDDVDTNLNAYLKLRIICAALNEGWEPKFYRDETRYYPWFWLYTKEEIDEMSADDSKERNMISTDGYQTEYAGFACAGSSVAPSGSAAYFGSRLCLKSVTLAQYCGRQFTDIWADFLLIRK